MLGLFSGLPSATTIIASSSEYANPFIAEFSIFIYIGVGLIVAATITVFLIRSFHNAMDRLRMRKYGGGKESSGWEHSDLP